MGNFRALIARSDIFLEQQQQRQSQRRITARTEASLRRIFDAGNYVKRGRHQLATFSREAHDDRPTIGVMPRPLEIPKLFQLQDHLADRLLRQQRAACDFGYGAAAQLQIRQHRGVRDACVGEAARPQGSDDAFVHGPRGARQQLAQIEAAAFLEFGERLSHRPRSFAVGR